MLELYGRMTNAGKFAWLDVVALMMVMFMHWLNEEFAQRDDVVFTVKLLVALAPVFALSLHCTYQLWFPAGMPLIENIVAVLFLVDALVWLRELSRKMEQFNVEERLSTAVKLKFTFEMLKMERFAGELRVTMGACVSTVKFLVALVPMLLTESLHETYQVWRPSAVDTIMVAVTLF